MLTPALIDNEFHLRRFVVSYTSQIMRLPRIRFTVRRAMITIGFVSILLAIVAHRERIRRFNEMVLNQEITCASAKAGFQNAKLARELAEHSLRLFAKEHAVSIADQLHLGPEFDAEQAEAEERVTRIIRQLDEVRARDERLARQAALTALKRYFQTFTDHRAVAQPNRVGRAPDFLEVEHIMLQGNAEAARTQERIKKITWEYEKALLNSLKRERGNYWW